MPDKRFVDAYNRIELDPESAERIWSGLEQELLPGKENEQTMKPGKPLRFALIAAAICADRPDQSFRQENYWRDYAQ